MKKNVIDVLQERGLTDALAGDGIREIVQNPTRVYCGFDPTADSLHVGNLVGIVMLGWFQRCGHTPVAIVGGATGMIGDPSGRSAERQFLSEEVLGNNLKGIRRNLETILKPIEGAPAVVLLNNFDWYKDMGCLQFLRDVGVLFRVGPMLAKESVRLRMQSEEGMSFTEFSYQILQGYDFLHLYREHGVRVQIGGSDQWGNITAGTDLIRKVLGQHAYGLTFPLLTRSDGQKFGKSEKGAIWLSPERLSPYEFYQYLVRTDDADVIKLMKMITFMEIEEILHYEKRIGKSDDPREAQKKLAAEVTQLVHGTEGLNRARLATEGLSPGTDTALDAKRLQDLLVDLPNCERLKHQVCGQKVVDLLVNIGIQPSKGEARRLLRNGGVYLNNQKIENEHHVVTEEMLLGGKLLLIAAGKKHKMVVQLTDVMT